MKSLVVRRSHEEDTNPVRASGQRREQQQVTKPTVMDQSRDGHSLAKSVLLAEPHGARDHCPHPKCNQETDPDVSREGTSCSVG